MIKPFWKTSEFWLTVLTALTTIFETVQGNLDPKLAAIISAVLAAFYALSRGLAKSGKP